MSGETMRAQYVAALRAIADLLEGDESIPLPYSSRLQAGIDTFVDDDGTRRKPTQAERFAALRLIADHLGVDVVEQPNETRSLTLRMGPIEYLVYVGVDAARDTSGPRVVPATEDAILIGRAR